MGSWRAEGGWGAYGMVKVGMEGEAEKGEGREDGMGRDKKR